MKGEFSRITYDEKKQYALVLMQQGRVQLDADWNEQAIIHWQNLIKLAGDLIGEHGGANNSFNITEIVDSDGNVVPTTNDFIIEQGHYYVDGVLCENENDTLFTGQEDYPISEGEGMDGQGKYLVYLHVWWQHITSLEDDGIREVALGGPDTATRIKTVWQVKVNKVDGVTLPDFKEDYESFKNYLIEKQILKRTTGMLKAQAKKTIESTDPCIASPENKYRGTENQLYRVEIHKAGVAGKATFKWSRDNGSVVFPIKELSNEVITLENIGRDKRFGLKAGNWVEVVDDIYVLQRKTEDLLKVESVNPDENKITLSDAPQFGRDLSIMPLKNPLLRRWDHSGDENGGTIVVTESENGWIELEDGVQIKFLPQTGTEAHYYKSGDWWWIPARTATGDVEWPRDEGGAPIAQKPIDPGHRYAPLALIDFNASPSPSIDDLRRVFKQLWK
jgi:hypothetical protein